VTQPDPAAAASTPASGGPWRAIALWIRRAENGLAIAAILLTAVLPVLEMFLRLLINRGIPGCVESVQHLTLWVGFLGAMIASREKRHLALATGADRLPPLPKRIAGTATAAVSACVAAVLAWGSWHFTEVAMKKSTLIGGWLPIWVAQVILPVSFAVMAFRFVIQAQGWIGKGVALLGIPAAGLLGFPLADHAGTILWPGVGLLLVAAAAGAPIFVAMGGAAALLFFADGVAVAAIPVEAYRLVASPTIPTIPLFTLTGFLLAEGKASERLLRLFRALFGWMPGGLAIVATLVCAFFTTFTGASGVTILALGGLLLPMLLKSGYREPFSVGLLTSSGSIGLLFPPSLPVILYGVIAHVPISDLFVAGAIPGALLVLAVAVFGVLEARRARVPRQAFDAREAARALWAAKWEVLLPGVALYSLFGGFCTMVEAAALTVGYSLLVQTAIHRELHPLRDLPRVCVTSLALVGGVIAILGAAMGLTNYLVDAEVPMNAAAWVKEHVHSRFVFLLALNLFLIVVGALMDIFSAIMVVVPLILPAAAAFGIHPLHLGIIFLANLELGYLVPPVGENLFLASYRFGKPILRVAACTLPFILAILAAVLVITYVPGLTLIAAGAPSPDP
jgi:tripartite ATP-independent transporter DctM subunit